MLPVTHGPAYTRLMILRYTCGLFAVTMLPYVIGMSGLLYLACAIGLSGVFVWRAIQMYRHYSDALARSTFKYSILYLAALFSALLVDHYLP
jgi:protoheme IX farnesyltransferase